jgi:hypothetical protein
MQRRILLVLLGSLLLLGCSRSSSSRPPSGHTSDDLRKLTVKQVEERIDTHDGKLAIYDCNTKEQYDGAHLPGARWVDHASVTAADLPADKTTTLIFYCFNEL